MVESVDRNSVAARHAAGSIANDGVGLPGAKRDCVVVRARAVRCGATACGHLPATRAAVPPASSGRDGGDARR